MTTLVGVLAAAGLGTRFGAHKLLARRPDGVPVGVAAARSLITAVPECVAVVRPDDRELAELLAAVGLEVVVNPRADDGLGTSIACGVRARCDAAGWLIALGDMPAVQPHSVRSVARALAAGAGIVAPVFRGRRGHPVGFAAEFYAALTRLVGDTGARTILAMHSGRISEVPVSDPGVAYDVDCRGDLEIGFCDTADGSGDRQARAGRT